MNPTPPPLPTNLGPPELDGALGSAWMVPIVSPPELLGTNPIVGQWLFWGPLISKTRQFWLVSTLSLDPTTGYPVPIIRARHATHELVIYRVKGSTMPDLTTHGSIVVVQPPNLGCQFACTSANAAAIFARKIVQGCCEGTIFPEPGVIGGAGEYHGERFAILLEESDPGWHLTRGGRPPLGLAQREAREKEWTISRDGPTKVSRTRIHLN